MRYPADYTSGNERKGNCGVMAVAMCAGITLKEANEILKKNMMPWQKRHVSGTYHEQRVNSLKALGVPVKEIPVEGRINLRRYVSERCEPNKTYMIKTATHVVTAHNGIVADQVEIANVNNHGSRRRFVKNVLEIGN